MDSAGQLQDRESLVAMGAGEEGESEVKVGDSIWYFDENRRVYPPGKGLGGPIWREHWREMFIVGETKQSWIVSHSPVTGYTSWKLAKRDFKQGRTPQDWALSQEDIDELAYCHDHARRIGDLVARMKNAEVLREVAALVGYEEKST